MLLERPATITMPYLISESIHGNTKMQKLLYQKFAMPMFYVCLRYLKHRADAEYVLQEGFIKVFKNLDSYKSQGSFEGWVRKIMIRTALTHIRDNRKYSYHVELIGSIEEKENNINVKLAEKDILGSITKLPPGFKRIFILYAIEG